MSSGFQSDADGRKLLRGRVQPFVLVPVDRDCEQRVAIRGNVLAGDVLQSISALPRPHVAHREVPLHQGGRLLLVLVRSHAFN